MKTSYLLFIFVFSLFPRFLMSQTYIVPDLERDDFKNQKSWWSINYAPSSGYNHSMTFNNGYLKANLVDPLDGGTGGSLQADMQGMENVGISTANLRPIYDRRMQLDLTIRVKTLNNLPVGSRGWGFWKSEQVPITINQATWFMEQKADPDSSWAPQETWWQARTLDGVDNTYDFSTDIDSYDNQQWHVYKVCRYSGSAADGYYEHYIDGTLIQRKVPYDFPDSSIINEDFTFNCWNDNLVYHFIEGGSNPDSIAVTYNGWLGTSSFVVDYIEIIKDGYDPSYSVSPADNSDMLRLREYESEMDNGITDGLWKTYSFDTYADNCVIVATAKAEEMDSYDNDDDLKIEVDSKDYGYNSSKSWNGDVDQSLPKTIVIDTSMAAGSHTINLYSRVTPLLCDVNVFSSTDGTLALDTLVNDSAPSGSNNLLWKTFTFTCNSGPVAIYLSGSADEEDGWDHIAADTTGNDDELRIMVDNTDFGWANANALKGNTLYGDIKTILLRPTLSAGQHSIKLYTRETPTVYRVLAYAKNGDSGLPVELSQFHVQQREGNAVIRWVTESEVNNLGFNIFRAVMEDSTTPSSNRYRKINTRLIRGQGSSSHRKDYEYRDKLPSATFVWYRLQDVSYGGQRTMHQAVRITPNTEHAPHAFHLSQNYPNPFGSGNRIGQNAQTTIRYQLSRSDYVQLIVFNVLGQQVKTLVAQQQEAGSYAVVFKGGRLAEGIYYYQLKTASASSEIRKMILIK